MRLFMLVLMLLSFVPATYVSVADAAFHASSHSKSAEEHNKQDLEEDCHLEHENEQCDECLCCSHSHVTAIIPFLIYKKEVDKQDEFFSEETLFISRHIIGQNRPPRI